MIAQAIKKGAEKNTLRLIGFKVLLAWHYLVLFSPLLIGSIEADSFSFFYQRQLTLYFFVAVTFLIMMFISKRFLHKNKTMPSVILIGSVGALAMLSTLGSALVLDSSLVWLRLGVTAFLGFIQAFLMVLWLHYYQVAAGSHLYRSFAVDMIFGAVIGFFACMLKYPVSLIVIVVLPLIATISLLYNWWSVKPQKNLDEKSEVLLKTKLSQKTILAFFVKTSVPTAIFALIFGLLQGAFIESEIALLMADNPAVILGISVCGILLLLIPENLRNHLSIDIIQRFSMLFFVSGIIVLSFLMSDMSIIAAEIIIMAGFNLFDFAGLILAITVSKRLHLKSFVFVGAARALTYLGLACGLLSGRQIMVFFGGGSFMLLAVSGIAIVLIVATSLIPFYAVESVDKSVQEALKTIEPEKLDGRELENTTTKSIAKDKGSHGLMESKKPKTVPDVQDQHEKKALSVKAEESQQKKPSKGNARKGGIPTHNGVAPENAKRDTPWRRVCHEIAVLYKLSPRETEIFLLIAKGRNAEYLQQKLVISTHTAKTHIANIYHKLGVHSSQEMLSLVESFKEQDKKVHHNQHH